MYIKILNEAPIIPDDYIDNFDDCKFDYWQLVDDTDAL